jgi:hypothetical protein
MTKRRDAMIEVSNLVKAYVSKGKEVIGVKKVSKLADKK